MLQIWSNWFFQMVVLHGLPSSLSLFVRHQYFSFPSRDSDSEGEIVHRILDVSVGVKSIQVWARHKEKMIKVGKLRKKS